MKRFVLQMGLLSALCVLATLASRARADYPTSAGVHGQTYGQNSTPAYTYTYLQPSMQSYATPSQQQPYAYGWFGACPERKWTWHWSYYEQMWIWR